MQWVVGTYRTGTRALDRHKKGGSVPPQSKLNFIQSRIIHRRAIHSISNDCIKNRNDLFTSFALATISVCPTIIAKARSSSIGIIVGGKIIGESGEVSLPHYST